MKIENFIGKIITIKIDRPLGSIHPKHEDIKYEVNYGYVPDTVAPDGEEVDAYLLGVSEPVEEFVGKCIAAIKREDDDDDKLVIVPEDMEFDDDEILDMVNFQEKFFDSKVVR
ncbi:inorganic pyrophosphatase [Candidatus Parcubacteria bacterium]|nr:MAG: inorganic pyrophosphatase [Candidatus Parcubacteria bacterium]